jgi:low affinity Fe/Cu permease
VGRRYEMVRRFLTGFANWLASPLAVVAVGVYALAWYVFDQASFNWNAVATLATLVMTLFIQRAEHRDTQAIHAKLDELLRVNGDARNELITLDDREPEEIEEHREKMREQVRNGRPRASSASRRPAIKSPQKAS